MLIIVNYGLGNLSSVQNMVHRVGGQAKISNDPEEILRASKIILPGVGAFDYGVESMHALGIFTVLRELGQQGIPLLGICLGMQLLGKRSDEGTLMGLGLIDAEFKRFSFPQDTSLRVPHVGWNTVEIVKKNPFISLEENEVRFYFTHSYHAFCHEEADVIANAFYGYSFPVIFGRDNIWGVQFHPEKSHRFGMALFKKFLDFAC